MKNYWEKPTLEVVGDANELILGSGNVKDEFLNDTFVNSSGNPIGTSD